MAKVDEQWLTEMIAEELEPVAAAWGDLPHGALVRVASHWLAVEYGVDVDRDQVEDILAACAEGYEPPELCPSGSACPTCHTHVKDMLEWDAEGWLHCTICGTVYDPATGKIKQEATV